MLPQHCRSKVSSLSAVSTGESSTSGFCVFLGSSVWEDVGFISASVPGNERESCGSIRKWSLCLASSMRPNALSSPSAAHNVVGSPELPALPSLWHIVVMKIASCLQNQIISAKSRRLCEKQALFQQSCILEKINELVKNKTAVGMGRRHHRTLLTSSGTQWRDDGGRPVSRVYLSKLVV